jgi:acyl dehydratase/uncharacterized OB-fold protein
VSETSEDTESDAQSAALLERVREYIGKTGPDRRTRDDVNQAMIRHWCDAMTDYNPVYTDVEAAARTVHGGIVAPPMMLDTWAMPGLPRYMPAGEDTPKKPGLSDSVFAVLDEAGFTSVVATNTTHEYRRYLRPGDRLHLRQTLTDVSPEKQTGLGVGHFVTWVTEYFDQNDEQVGSVEFRVLKFKPGTGRQMPQSDDKPAAPPVRPRPGISRDTQFFWDGIDAGELRIQKCRGCEALHHPPMVRCAGCGSYDLGYVVSKGRGKVYSFVEVEYPRIPAFDYPLLVVLVELEEGTRILSNVVGASADDVEVGTPLELAIEAVDPEMNLPLFRLKRPPRREATLPFGEVKEGEKLVPCPVPITPTLIVAGAIASRDFQDVHHDVELSKKRGSPDIFMNIMTTGGLVGRYVTDWAGSEAIVRSMKIRLGVPNYPGDTMTFTGEVKAAEVRDGKGVVEVSVRGRNRIGDHVNATVELELPQG